MQNQGPMDSGDRNQRQDQLFDFGTKELEKKKNIRKII